MRVDCHRMTFSACLEKSVRFDNNLHFLLNKFVSLGTSSPSNVWNYLLLQKVNKISMRQIVNTTWDNRRKAQNRNIHTHTYMYIIIELIN